MPFKKYVCEWSYVAFSFHSRRGWTRRKAPWTKPVDLNNTFSAIFWCVTYVCWESHHRSSFTVFAYLQLETSPQSIKQVASQKASRGHLLFTVGTENCTVVFVSVELTWKTYPSPADWCCCWQDGRVERQEGRQRAGGEKSRDAAYTQCWCCSAQTDGRGRRRGKGRKKEKPSRMSGGRELTVSHCASPALSISWFSLDRACKCA